METLNGLAQAIEASPFGVWARGSALAYPFANLVHLLGLVMLAGGIGLLDLRIAGLFRRLPVKALSDAVTPIAVMGLVLFVLSGPVMFAADAVSLARSSTFQWKLALIAVALVNAFAFRLIWQKQLAGWDLDAPPPAARLMALASIALWLWIASLGRLIAYN